MVHQPKHPQISQSPSHPSAGSYPSQPPTWASPHPPTHGQPPNYGYPPQGYYPQGQPPPGWAAPPQPIQVVVQNNVGAHYPGAMQRVRIANRSKGVALLLALFLGGLGAHRFYLGDTGLGILYLLFFWTFIPAFIALIDLLIILVMPSREFDLRYNYA